MCEPEPAVSLRVPLAMAGAVLAAGAVADFLAAWGLVLLAVAAVTVVVTYAIVRALHRRTVVHWPAMERARKAPVKARVIVVPQIREQNENRVPVAAGERRALPAGRPVVPGVVVSEHDFLETRK